MALQEIDMKINYNGKYIQMTPLAPKIEPNERSIIAHANKFQATKTKLTGKRPRGRPARREETTDQMQ